MEATLIRSVVTIGRGPGNDIVLDDPHLSRRHCRILWYEEGILIEDLGSINGTVVNGQAVLHRRILRNGDVLSVGAHRFVIRGDSLVSF